MKRAILKLLFHLALALHQVQLSNAEAPDFARYLIEFPFGDVYTRQV
jgi:hypothetical protein